MDAPTLPHRSRVSRALVGLLLLGSVGCASSAQAQQDYVSPLRFTVLGEEGNTYIPGDCIATDANGTLYIGDFSNAVIRKVSPDGTILILEPFLLSPTGERVPAKLDFPTGMAVDGSGNIYADSNQGVCKIAPDGMTTVLAAGVKWSEGIAVDAGGTIYLSDTYNHAIRKIAPDGTMSTFAGRLGESGNVDGTASARFHSPTGVAVDASGTVYVADRGNLNIRKITPDGMVSTLAGKRGGESGVGSPGRVISPLGIAVDAHGTVFATDGGYQIYRITGEGVFTAIDVLGGFAQRIESGFLDEITVDRSGTIYVMDGWYGAVLVSPVPPSFTSYVAGQSVAPGASVTFSATVAGAGPITYQWHKDRVAIAGATAPSLTIDAVQAADLGSYTLVATSAGGSSTSNPAALTFIVSKPNRISNLALRSNAGTGSQVLTVGVVLGGLGTSGVTPLLIRGAGPSLAGFGVPGFLADPRLTLFSSTTVAATNDNWNGDMLVADLGKKVGAFAFVSESSRDAAFLHGGLGAGAYTVQLAGVGSATGIALVELYDASLVSGAEESAPRMINLSARTQVGSGADRLIASFTLVGTDSKTLLIRAVGPTLGAFGVAGALADPQLEFLRGSTLVQFNDNWSGDAAVSSAAARVGAFPFDAASRNAALLVAVQPGTYSVQVSGVNDTKGVALLEIYEVP